MVKRGWDGSRSDVWWDKDAYLDTELDSDLIDNLEEYVCDTHR